MKISKKTVFLPLLGLFLVSCLTNPQQQNEERDQLLITLELGNINDEIVAGDDTVNVAQLRFLYGETFLLSSNDDTLIVNNNVIQVTHQFSTQEVKGLANGTFESDNVFGILNFEIKQAEQSDAGSGSNFDEEAFLEGESEDQRYSLIINGAFNGDSFTFKSTRNFNFEFPIEDDSGGSTSGLLYNLTMKTDVISWFLNASGDGLLDPGDPANAATINDNIQQSLNLN